MPFPNEHACRLEDPGKFDKFNRKNCYKKHDGKCIDFIFGIKAGKSKVQALRYPKDTWSAKDARAHCKDKEGSFEAAGESDSQESEEIGKVKTIGGKIEYQERRFITDTEMRIKDDDGDGNTVTGYAAVFNKYSDIIGFFKELFPP